MWLTESNRDKHFLYAIPCASIFATIVVAGWLLTGGARDFQTIFHHTATATMALITGLAVGMEYKDRLYGNRFDLLDVAATLLGGILGVGTVLLIVFLIL